MKAPALPLVLAAWPVLYEAYVFVGIRGGRDAFLARVGEPSALFTTSERRAKDMT